MSALRQHAPKLIVSLLLSGVFVALLNAGGLRLWPEPSALERVEWWAAPAYFLLWCVVHVLRAARWQLLLAPLGKPSLLRVISVSFVGFAAIVVMPLRTGEMVRPYMIRADGKISGWAATGTIAAERIVDGLFLTLQLAIAMIVATPISPLPDRIGELPISVAIVPRATYAALVLFTTAFIAMGVFYFRRQWALRVLRVVVGAVSPTLAEWLAVRVEKVASGLGFLPRPVLFVNFVLLTAVYWLLNAVAAWVLARGAGFPEFRFSEACALTGVLALGILIPNAPGFFGAFQFSVYAALALYYPTEMVQSSGTAVVAYLYVLQLAVTVFGAALGLITERNALKSSLGESQLDD